MSGEYELDVEDYFEVNDMLRQFKQAEIDEELFYILWNPQSQKPPTVKFRTLKEAQGVAVSMAERHGEVFYVMRAISGSARSRPPIETIKLK